MFSHRMGHCDLNQQREREKGCFGLNYLYPHVELNVFLFPHPLFPMEIKH